MTTLPTTRMSSTPSLMSVLRRYPLAAFFTLAYTLATILLIGWGIYWQGFPQFSDLGWIK